MSNSFAKGTTEYLLLVQCRESGGLAETDVKGYRYK